MGLLDWLGGPGRQVAQQREIAALRKEVDRLRAQNERLNRAMRRCITCEYRLEVVGRR